MIHDHGKKPALAYEDARVSRIALFLSLSNPEGNDRTYGSLMASHVTVHARPHVTSIIPEVEQIKLSSLYRLTRQITPSRPRTRTVPESSQTIPRIGPRITRPPKSSSSRSAPRTQR